VIRLHYWFTRSGRAEQIRLLLAELGLEWTEVDTEWGTDAWRALAPDPLTFGAQPALVYDGFALTQSGVILSYLARRHGIAPASLEDQCRADAFVWSAEDLRMNAFRATSGPEATARTAKFLGEEWPTRWLALLDHHLAANGTGFLVGGALTHADVAWWDALDQVLAKVPGAVIPPGTRVAAFRSALHHRERLAAYLASERRPPAE
jgi:glutathione S-transferase